MLPDIAELQRRRIIEPLLHREVPLLVLRGPKVLIGDSDSLVRVTREIDRCALRRRREARVQANRALRKNSKGWIDRELLVRSAAFLESGDRVTAADHQIAPARRRPGKAQARLPVADTKVVVVESVITEVRGAGNSIPGATRRINQPSEEPEVHHPIINFVNRRMIFEANAEVERKAVGQAPVVLNIGAKYVVPVLEKLRVWAGISLATATQSKIEIGQPEPGGSGYSDLA